MSDLVCLSREIGCRMTNLELFLGALQGRNYRCQISLGDSRQRGYIVGEPALEAEGHKLVPEGRSHGVDVTCEAVRIKVGDSGWVGRRIGWWQRPSPSLPLGVSRPAVLGA